MNVDTDKKRTVILCGACSDCTHAHPSRRHEAECKGVYYSPDGESILVCSCPWRTKAGAEMRAPTVTREQLEASLEQRLPKKAVKKAVAVAERESAPAPKDEGRPVVVKKLRL